MKQRALMGLFAVALAVGPAVTSAAPIPKTCEQKRQLCYQSYPCDFQSDPVWCEQEWKRIKAYCDRQYQLCLLGS